MKKGNTAIFGKHHDCSLEIQNIFSSHNTTVKLVHTSLAFTILRDAATPRAGDAIHPVLREVGLGDSETTATHTHVILLIICNI